MASNEQLNLSTFIKNVHKDLRHKAKRFGSAAVWEEHCANKIVLEQYAFAMKDLATKYWDKTHTQSLKLSSRISWTHKFCIEYFIDETIKHFRQKDADVAAKLQISINEDLFISTDSKLKLLDVGSCYDPFTAFDIFDVTPIDIAPANNKVFKCDFLNVSVGQSFRYDEKRILELPGNYFHIIVFSLLLEYLPTSGQRYLACLKAYNVLKTEGLLIIITPDSKHVGANVKIIKSWQHILAGMGFSRIKYEKLQHIHCMVFRKSLNKEISKRWSLLHNRDNIFTEMYIPQDFNETCIELAETKSNVTDVVDVNLFEQLPHNFD